MATRLSKGVVEIANLHELRMSDESVKIAMVNGEIYFRHKNPKRDGVRVLGGFRSKTAHVSDESVIERYALVTGNGRVEGRSTLVGFSEVGEDARVENVVVHPGLRILGDTYIQAENGDIVSITGRGVIHSGKNGNRRFLRRERDPKTVAVVNRLSAMLSG